jgi:large subunit ribosomal protein L27
MAHTKSQGAANRTVNVAGKRLGVKKFSGEYVKPGNIIIRQKGTKFHPGSNVSMGRDYTIFSTIEGNVVFQEMTGFQRGKKKVSVIPFVAVAKTEKAPKATKPAKSAK